MADASWQKYIDAIQENNVFACVKDQLVLELAANGGWHSRLIYEHNPKKLVCVEPDNFFTEPLYTEFASQHNDVECVWDTYNNYLINNKNKFDVVVCCGLLYHLHSPLDCIEKIINIHQPKTFILESIDAEIEHLNDEVLNLCGNAFEDNYKHIPYSFIIPIKKYKEILSNVGYTCIKEFRWADYGVEHTSKQDAVMIVFENEQKET